MDQRILSEAHVLHHFCTSFVFQGYIFSTTTNAFSYSTFIQRVHAHTLKGNSLRSKHPVWLSLKDVVSCRPAPYMMFHQMKTYCFQDQNPKQQEKCHALLYSRSYYANIFSKHRFHRLCIIKRDLFSVVLYEKSQKIAKLLRCPSSKTILGSSHQPVTNIFELERPAI